jgi:hypothetical protein
LCWCLCLLLRFLFFCLSLVPATAISIRWPQKCKGFIISLSKDSLLSSILIVSFVD